MREVVLHMQVTFDGYVGTRDGNVDWAFRSFDEEFTVWSVEELWQAGVHIMGGATGRGLAEYWPSAHREARDEPFAPPMNEMPKVVFSKTIDRLDWNNTTIARGDLQEEITRLKQEPGKHILVHGGTHFVHSLTKLGLIDEYRLVVHPVVLGSGQPLFPELPQPLLLDLVGTKAFPSGAVMQAYRPVRGS